MSEDERQAFRVFDNNDRSAKFRKDNENRNFLKASGVLFEQAMAQTRMAICLSDPNQEDAPIVFANRAFMELTGYDEDEIVGRNCRFLQGEKTDRQAVSTIRAALEDERVIVVELLNYRKDGTTFWNALHLGPIYDENKNLLYYFGSQWDVSDVHSARAEEAHSKAMARELSHRMKNVFAVIASIVRVTGRMEGTPELAQRINNRIYALGRAYEPTLDDARTGSIEVGQAIRAVLAPYDPSDDRIEYLGNGLRAHANVISLLGLTLHELATNAMKYGSLSGPAGTVAIDWFLSDEADGRRLAVHWTERGGPPVDSQDRDSGTGQGLMQVLLQAAEGTIAYDWREEGLHVTISIPTQNAEND